MTDYPPGEWSKLLVGAWWPSSTSTDSAVLSKTNRTTVADTYDDYAGVLGTILTGPLATQEGTTAETAKEAFHRGKSQSEQISERNAGKAESYGEAASSLESLRSELREVAATGNDAIDTVQNNKLQLDKVTPIVAIIGQANGEAARKSASWSAKLGTEIEKVLAADGDPRSAEQFAKDRGIDLPKPPSTPDAEAISQQVKSMLEKSDTISADPASNGSRSSLTSGGLTENNPVLATSSNQPKLPVSGQAEGALGVPPPLSTGVDNAKTNLSSQTLQANIGQPSVQVPDAPQMAASTSQVGMPAPGGMSAGSGAPGAFSGAGNAGAATGGGSPALPSTGALGGGSQALSPESLAQSFNSGVQAGAPASAGAEALSQGISDSVQSQPPPHAPPPITSTPTAATTGFAYDAPQHYSESAPAPSPAPDPQHQTMYAAPVAQAPAAPPMAAPPPAAPAGPLPTYGADLRPATSAAPPPPAAPAPLSAPVNPASGTAASSQPAVVRQQAATTPATAPTGLVENALTAAATGAAAGVASEQAVAQARLQRLLEAVARQEPKLRWAIGDREDGSTILVTDLASGWIPPHIEIPTGVQILAPEKRRGTVEHLLGEITNFAVWTPGHYLPPAKDVEPVQMSFRARQVPDIEELNWEITQAANWRDGLPRLAHTLAKAGVAGTGVLESESDLLYDYLTATRDNVVKCYPDDVDTTDVGNWQLLAAIGGLISKDTTTLKYHFAWFQALSMATQGGQR